MLDTMVLGFVAAIFLIFITISMIKIYRIAPKMGIGLVWGSLGLKLFFLSVYTISVKDYVENDILYATIILMSIIYSMVYTILKLKNDLFQNDKEQFKKD